MPYKAPGLSELIARAENNIQQRLKGSVSSNQEKILGVMAYAQAGLDAGLHEHLSWVYRQIIPGDADEAELLKHCQFWGIRRKQPTPAGGNITVAVNAAGTIPKNTRWQRSDSTVYLLENDLEVTTPGQTAVPVVAVISGAAGNAAPGTVLTLVTPVAGVGAQAVAENGLTGGSDIEPVAELLARLEFRAQHPPCGGNRYDYERWARECAGVTRAWCEPTWQGPGTVGVTFVMDGNADIVPGQADIDRVAAYIAGHPNPVTGVIEGQPEGPEVTVFAPTLKPVPMTIKISPKTDELKAEITRGINALFYNKCEPGSTLNTSGILRVIAASQSLTDFELLAPATAIYSESTELLVLGEITWA
ncbi:baseplate J/gp47 family protein [Erwinia tracheiphila]|uniref:Uncharacterized protein n=1 Tax=Erwinia tracheiphila TaxID=65700 RepID=A0A345CWB5_9GAMM|nr:baseplate J/gp47 family protein [Erwinia tracheiphila]AXF77732.1 hypothetical protein AV903_19515 [Erwinia tracheiphila]UIA83584.1 baseplate J/gp47 family protein [Erwinia tracheiphila]UIA92168.1 baseplate J/gp47 family protein [Erwinia tracheiphila]